MAKKYIDAEAALEAIEEVAIVNFELDSDFYHESMASVRAIPAADVAPVRHGHCIWHVGDNDYECSVCHVRCVNPLETYCPFCGAQLDESENK